MSRSKKGNYFKLLFKIKHTPGLEPVNDTPEIIVSTCGKEGGFMPKCKIKMQIVERVTSTQSNRV